MKFAFINVPSQELERPPAAAAAITACVKQIGWDCRIFDFNFFLNNRLTVNEWQECESFWRCKSLTLDPSVELQLSVAIKEFMSTVRDYSPDWIGLSVFTRFSVVPAFIMLKEIRKHIPNGKVVIGGNGSFAWPGSLPNLETHNQNCATFAEYAKEEKLVDYYIHGDGEDAIRELLSGNTTYPGINETKAIQIRDLDNLPIPDYTSIPPQDYYFTHEPGMYITASRGCIRKCTFCNIPEMWPKFATRSASNVVDEIVTARKNYNVNLFQFTDSLINGNLKIFRDINKQLKDIKSENPEFQNIKYLGQFICRDRNEQNEDDWQLMYEGGANLLVTGFEHFSPHVRHHMGKNYSNDDIDFHFAQSAKYNIRNVALMFIGYPVETLDDHQMNIEFLHRYQKYAKAGIIHMVRWGYTGMFRDSARVEKPGEVQLEVDPDFSRKFMNLSQGIRDIALGFGWVNKLNPDLTLRERIRRRLELHEISVKLGWPQTRNREELQILFNILNNLNHNVVNGEDFNDLDNLLDFH